MDHERRIDSVLLGFLLKFRLGERLKAVLRKEIL